MKMRGIIVLLWVMVVMTAPVLAVEGVSIEEENKFSLFGKYPGEYIWALVWFAVLLVVLWKFAWKPLLAGLTSRQEHIEKQISDAEKTRVEARKILDEYNARLADAERQGRDIITARTKEAEKQAKDVARQNQKALEQLKTRATAELARERIEAEEDLWGQAGDIVRRLGQEVFSKALDDADNQKLIDEAIARLKQQQKE